MSFLNNLMNEFGHKNQGSNQGGYDSYNQQPYPPQQSYGNQGPPQVPPPWIAEWDPSANRWLFINRETGERTFDYPRLPQQQNYGYGSSGYGGAGYGGSSYEQRGEYSNMPPQQQPSHSGRNMALGAAAGLAGGALLMHEGEKVEEHWDEDKYRMEQGFDNKVQDVEDAPEEVAGWTGRKVQDVEDIPQDVDNWKDREEYRVEQKWDDGVNDVENAPEDAANWMGRKVQDVEDIPQDIENRWDGDVDRVENRFDGGVQDVERFDDRVEDSYDDGRQEGRYDDRW